MRISFAGGGDSRILSAMSTNPFPGQRYRDRRASSFHADWVIAKIFKGSDGIEYALLEAGSDRTRRKTLALSIVTDARRFLPVAEPARS